VINSFLLDLDIASGKTNIAAGLSLAARLIKNSVEANQTSQCEQILVLLTDGVTSANNFDIDNEYGHILIFLLYE